MKELKIGERVPLLLKLLNNGLVKVVSFAGQVLARIKGNAFYCCARFRKDNKPVIFKEVKE